MEKFEAGYFYHIYNRGANKGNIFFELDDYEQFLKKYIYYLYPAVQTLCYCLMSNHFHALIRPRTVTEQGTLYNKYVDSFKSDRFHGKLSPGIKPYSASRQLAHFMNSYTRSFNKKTNRKGTLVEGPLKRIKINSDSHLTNLICYIHRNPIHHGITENYTEYPHSSFSDFHIEKNSFIMKNRVLDMFGGIDNFVEAHEEFKLKCESKMETNFYLEQ